MIQDNFHNPQRIFGLDLMRATAILMVLCSHCLWIFPPSDSFVAQLCKLFGFMGVEIFFVLSGFLIGKILYRYFLETPFSSKEVVLFLKRRWFRTLPNYYLVLLLNILISFYIGYSVDSIWQYFFFLHNFSKPLQPFFNESWTLSVEEWAYFIVPVILFLASKWFRNNRVTVFVAVVIVLILVFTVSKIYYNATTQNSTLLQWNSSLKSVVIYRIDSILYGILASFISLKYWKIWKNNKVRILLVGLLGLFFLNFGQKYFLTSSTEIGLFYNVVFIPANSIFICFTLPFFSNFSCKKNIINTIVTQVSLVSYSIYLLHYGVILQLLKFWIPTEKLTSIQLIFYTFFYIIITLTVSKFVYSYYEKPFTNLRDKYSSDKKLRQKPH